MSVGPICVREVYTASEDESVQAAAERMRLRAVGTLVVLDEERQPIGILTDRDLLLRVLAEGKSGAETKVSDVMTESPETVHEDTPLEQALSLMRAGPFRRLPVVDDGGKLLGLISLDDILDLLAEEIRDIGDLLRNESSRSIRPR